MTHKERMLKAARGEWADKLPWAPRLDLWFQSNFLRKTLPQEYANMNIEEIYDSLGVAHYYVTPNFYDYTMGEGMIDRGLGIYRVAGVPFEVELVNVDRIVEREGDVTKVGYNTPVGNVSCKLVYTEEMQCAGMSISWIAEHVIKEPKDFEVVAYIFRNMKITPKYEEYTKYENSVGDKGLVLAYTSAAGSPMHHIMKFLMDQNDFFLALYDYPEELGKLCESIKVYYDSMMGVTSGCSAEIVFLGANYDEKFTYPPFFEKYIQPYLQEYSGILHKNNKLLLSHCDGENQGLLSLLVNSGIDIAEAVCPKPMTKCTIREIKNAFKDQITIFGGIPSCIFLEDVISNDDFRVFMLNLFGEIAPGIRFILGISDTLPPDAKFDRVKKVCELIDRYGTLPLKI